MSVCLSVFVSVCLSVSRSPPVCLPLLSFSSKTVCLSACLLFLDFLARLLLIKLWLTRLHSVTITVRFSYFAGVTDIETIRMTFFSLSLSLEVPRNYILVWKLMSPLAPRFPSEGQRSNLVSRAVLNSTIWHTARPHNTPQYIQSGLVWANGRGASSTETKYSWHTEQTGILRQVDTSGCLWIGASNEAVD